jgi:hypothetical protein
MTHNEKRGKIDPTSMPHFLLTFGDASRPPVGAVILEAPPPLRSAPGAAETRAVEGRTLSHYARTAKGLASSR